MGVLAMNSWAVRFRAVRRHVLVIGSDIGSTPPIPGPKRTITVGKIDAAVNLSGP